MAKHRKKSETSESVDIDLTPMIDVVFQLIIFFLVVTQITTQDNVNLQLPDAIAANKEEQDAKKLFTVHIAPQDQSTQEDLPSEFGYFCYGQPNPKQPAELVDILKKEGDIVNPELKREGRNADGISENMVYVRCDARAPAQYFAILIEKMVEAKIYKIKVGIMKEPEN